MRLFTRSILIVGYLGMAGCSAPWTQKEPDSELQRRRDAIQEVLQSEEKPRLISEAAAIGGTDLREYEGFGIVNGLMDTGGDVRPGSQRKFILQEMRTEGVDSPNLVLGSKSTALAQLRVFVGPECAKGENVDVLVEVADHCEATSLRNGWLMPSRVLEMQFLGGSVKQSDLKARAQGSLVVLPASVTKKELNNRSAVVLGGARVLESRSFFIRIRDTLKHVTTSAAMSRAINDHYSFYDGAERKGVATAKNDKVIQLEVPARHRWDIQHYTDSILAIGFIEEPDERRARLAKCRSLMAEPTAARQACLELESVGKEGIPALEEAMQSGNPEIQFYAAYSLSYLDHPPAVPVLIELAKKVPEFRPLCLTGLQLHKHHSAKDALEQLLQEDEPELRYGALLALRRRDPQDAMAQGTRIGDLVHVIQVPSEKSLVTVSLQERPEIAVFGDNCGVQMPFFEVNARLTMRGEPDGKIRLVRFQPSDEDLTAIVSPDVLSVVEGFRTIGATYNDIVVWLDEASRQNWISAPVAMNPRPTAGRVYYRNAESKARAELAASGDVSQSQPERSDKKSWWRLK